MKKITAVVIVIILVSIISISYFGLNSIYNPNNSPPSDSNPPTNSTSNNPPTNSTSQTLTYVDVTNRSVTVKLPVNRIIPIMAIDLVFALGAQDKVVGRSNVDDEAATFLPSIMAIPVAGSVEMILEMKPDLVLVSELYSPADVELLEKAGIPVIVDRTVRPRRTALIETLGIMLGAEEKAKEFNDFEAYYENLVKDRVKNIPESEKPVVYFEMYMPGYSCGPGNSFHDLLLDAGAINMARDEPFALPYLSPEYTIERNPDIIIRMLTYFDGLDQASFVSLKAELVRRPGFDQIDAVKNNKVYIVKNIVIVHRETIGLLYFAKWFHPDLFTDIDPAAIHAEMLHKFYGTDLQGVFTYP